MSILSRFRGLFNRKTQPSQTDQRMVWLGKHASVPITHETALKLSTCFACVRVIAEDVAKLPWHVFGKSGNKRTRLDGSQIQRILNTRPNPEMGAFTFRETLMGWALTYGNGYAEIERDMAGRPVALWPLSPDRVEAARSNGRIVYEVSNGIGEKTILEQSDVFHVHGIGFDGLTGYSMVSQAAEALGLSIAAEEHGASFYGNNTTPGLSLKTSNALSDEAYERLKKDIKEKTGSRKAYKPMILEEGLDFANPQMSQVDAQYVETRRLQIEEVCRWWRVPPHKVSELSRAHFANVENLNIDYATDTLMPWIKRLEEEADFKLISSRSQAAYTKIAIQGLMRGDSAARSAFYREMFNIGSLSINDVRAMEDLDPIGPEGDEYFMQSAMTTVKRIVEPPQNPAQIMEPTAIKYVARFFSDDLRDANDAKERFKKDRRGFLDWMTNYYTKAASRMDKALNDITDSLASAYQHEIDHAALLSAYAEASAAQVLNLYDGKEVDHDAVTDAFLKVLAHEDSDEKQNRRSIAV